MAKKRTVQMRRRSRRRAAIVLVPTIAGTFIAGTAFAYWSTTGTGSATAATGAGTGVTVSQTSAVTGLSPGGSDVTIPFKINNPKLTSQYIASVTISLSSITKISDGTTATGCTAADFQITQPSAINQNLPTGDTLFPSSGAAIRMLETGVNQDACKSVNVNLAFAAA